MRVAVLDKSCGQPKNRLPTTFLFTFLLYITELACAASVEPLQNSGESAVRVSEFAE